MKRTVLISIMILFIMGACRTSRNATNTVPSVVLDNRDSVRTEYIETIRIDTMIVEVPVALESIRQTVPDSTSHLETSLAESDAWINPDGSLGHSINNKDKNLKAKVQIPVKDTQTKESRARIEKTPVPYPKPIYIEKNLTKWQIFRINAFWYLVIFLIISVVIILRTAFKKLI